MILGKSISKQELINQLRQEIKVLVEQIMRPETTDERRFKLDVIYKEKLNAFRQLGGVFNEVLTKEGWRSL
jgi:hypothetical protein